MANMTGSALVAFAATVVSSLIGTAIVRRMALRLGLVDVPDTHRKLHRQPRALGGGVAILMASGLTVGLLLLVPNPWQASLRQAGSLLPLVPASLAIVVLGLVDDARGLRGRQKLLGQVAAVAILMFGGLIVRRFTVLGLEVELGLLAIPFTLFWMLGAINAVNLLDGLDGLATTVGIVLTLAIAALAALSAKPAVTILALVFAGSLIGFLRMNFPPASIFLGDAGSMLIGLVVGALAIFGSLKGPGTVLLAAPLALWTIPIFDSASAILRRRLTGRSIYTTDHGHLHHRMLDRFGSNARVLAFVAVSCGATSLAALAGVFWNNDSIALVCGIAVVAMFILTGLFGRAETLLLLGYLRAVARSLLGRRLTGQSAGIMTAVRLQGSRRWDVLWTKLAATVEEQGLNEVRLDLTLPADKEDYHAVWQRPGTVAEAHWRLEYPLVAGERPIGRVTLVGRRPGGSARQSLDPLVELLEPLEEELWALINYAVPERPSPPAAGPPERRARKAARRRVPR